MAALIGQTLIDLQVLSQGVSDDLHMLCSHQLCASVMLACHYHHVSSAPRLCSGYARSSARKLVSSVCVWLSKLDCSQLHLSLVSCGPQLLVDCFH